MKSSAIIALGALAGRTVALRDFSAYDQLVIEF